MIDIELKRFSSDVLVNGLSPLITPALLQFLHDEFSLDWDGIHGITHWNRVRQYGLMLAKKTGANERVVEYFSVLHDIKRQTDHRDPLHGVRAAGWVKLNLLSYLELSVEEITILLTAIEGHCDGKKEGDITVLTCWDADRLDLFRGGHKADAITWCTAEARNRDYHELAESLCAEWLEKSGTVWVEN